MGKTTLVSGFLANVGDDAHVLWGACDDLLTPRALGPWWDMGLDEPELAAALADGDRAQLYGTVITLLGRALRPTVMVIEDVQWADEATLDLVKYVGRRIDRSHGLLVLTYREDQMTTDDRLRFVMGDLPPHSIVRLPLAPLSESAVRNLAGEGRANLGELYAQSGGNPFLVRELLSAPDGEVPLAVRDVFAARVARLGKEARDLAELVSVVPGRVERTLLEAGPPDSAAALDEAEQTGVLTAEPDHIAFRHELARRVVESGLSGTRRRELNSAVVSRLIATNGDRARIVHHAREAGDVEALMTFAPEAARMATEVDSHTEAHAYYLALGPHYGAFQPAVRAEILVARSHAALLVNEIREAIDAIEEAISGYRELDDQLGLGVALSWRSRLAWLDADRPAAVELADRAVEVLEEVLPKTPALAQAYSNQSQLAMLAWDVEGTVEAADRAIALAAELGDEHAQVSALVNKGTALLVHDLANIAVIEHAIERAERIGYQEEMVRGMMNMAWGLYEHREVGASEELAKRVVQIAVEHDQITFEDYGSGIVAMCELLRGEWFDAEDRVRSVLARPNILVTSLIVHLTVLGVIQLRRGNDEAAATVAAAWESATATQELQRIGHVAPLLAEKAWLDGETSDVPDNATETVTDALELGEAWIAGQLAYWLWKAGALLSVPGGLPDPYRLQVDGEWEEAARLWEQLGMPYERAMALSEGDDEAQIEAVEMFDALGAYAVAAKVRGQLRRRGVSGVPGKPRSATITHPAGLTERQAEVLILVAEGLSNPDIADRLFVSSRTVDHHVSAILTKLGAANRQDAVEIARDLGVLVDT